MTEQDATEPQRQQMIARLIEDVRATHNAGKEIDDATLCESHPHLMPELGTELQKLRRIVAARRAAAAPPTPISDSTTEDMPIPTALINDLEKPDIQVPGYSVLREISRGGQAAVYLATQLSTGRKVALKLMHDGPFASDRAVTRFRREVQALAALNHPNIVAIIDTGKTPDGARFITMNYISGMNLTEYMKDRLKKDPADPSKLLRLFLKICDAINAAHRLGIIHRDLKPSNIRVDERGEPHILDFGLARTALDHALASPDHAVSVTGEFLGSLPWSSPEQAEGNPEKIDIRTDVYSLGVILYQILTGGRFPYDVVGNMRDVLNNILTTEPIPPSKIASSHPAKTATPQIKTSLPVVNEIIEKIVLKALAKKPAERYPSAGELGRDIARYLAGQRTASRDAKLAAPSTALTPSARKYARLTATGVLLLALTLIAIYFLRPAQPLPANQSAATPASQPSLALASSATGPASNLVVADSQAIPAAPSSPPNQPMRTIDLLQLLDPAKDTISGTWQLDATGLHSSGSGVEAIEFPYAPPAEYDYKIVFEKVHAGSSIQIICHADKQLAWDMGRYYMGFSAYAGAAGPVGPQHPENPTHVEGGLPDAEEITWVLELRKNHARILINGREVESSAMDYSAFGYPRPFPKFTDPNTVGIGVGNVGVFVKSAQITEITGQGKLLRDQKAGTDATGALTSPADLFSPADLSLLHIDPQGVITVDKDALLHLRNTAGRNFTLTGEMYMDSVSDGLPDAEIDSWTKSNGGVALYARSTDRLHRYELTGKAIRAKRVLLEGQLLSVVSKPLFFPQPDHQWIPFRFDVADTAIHVMVGNQSAALNGPLSTTGDNLLCLAPGAKLRDLHLVIAGTDSPPAAPAHKNSPTPPPAPSAPSDAQDRNATTMTAGSPPHQSLSDIFNSHDLQSVHVDADGTITSDKQRNLTLLGTEGKNFTISGELSMDSEADADKAAANGLITDGRVDFVVRGIAAGDFYRLNGKTLGSVHFDQPDNQWIPFRFDVSGDGIHAVVGGVAADLKGPIRTDGINLLRIAAGAKIRKLSLTIH